ncbi:1,4-beta-xylanase, partial [Enterococcus faecalis]|nr:1,4-beta-xylanase [Enterococcus faecalis]
WESELVRIEQVVKRYNKPFFFCEVGCPSRKGSQYLPNDWQLNGSVDQSAQKAWYDKMFAACQKYPWVKGFGIWDWKADVYPLELAD